jgi:NAD+ diphosphatase
LDEDIMVDRAELSDARWISRDEVKTILQGLHRDISAPRLGAIAASLIAAWADDKLQDASTWKR